MNIYAMFEALRQQDLSAVAAQYDALIDAETKASEARAERLRELVSVEKAESKMRIEALQAGKLIALAQIEQRYNAPKSNDAAEEMAGVIVTGSGYDAGNK